MLSPNQIKMQTFTSAGRGAYRAADVDAFMQQVYISFTELMSENASMKKKFVSLSSIIDEYNAGKNAIATALVKAQAVADDTMLTAKTDAAQIVADAKDEANRILNETRTQAEDYAREKKETADAYFARAAQELQRVMTEAKAQSDVYVAEVNAQADALIADANEKAAAIVGAAYKDAKVAKEKTEEIIERANVEIETTRNEILSFKQTALQLLSALVPQVEGIDPDEYAVPNLEAVTQVPTLEANRESAPVFELKETEEQPEEEPVNVQPEAAPAAEDEPDAQPEEDDPFDFSAHDDLIAKMESILHDDAEPEKPVEDASFETPTVTQMPAYHPYVPKEEDAAAQPVYEEDDEEELLDFEEIEPEDDAQNEQQELPDVDDEPLPAEEDDAGFEDQDDAEDEDEDEPASPFKFRLTKNFDIFDDDND